MGPPAEEQADAGEAAERSLEEMEERVRKVQRLDPFSFNVRDDGRFSCHLEKPVRELSPDEARAAIRVLELMADRIRGHLEESDS